MRRSARHAASLLLLAIAATPAPARADDLADVLAANHAFDQALSHRDMRALDALWAHDADVTCIHPSGRALLVGWEAVRKSWAEGTFRRFGEMNVTMADPHVRIHGTVAVVVGVEAVRAKRADDGQAVEFQALTTNTYEKRDGRWLMTHHHASRAAR